MFVETWEDFFFKLVSLGNQISDYLIHETIPDSLNILGSIFYISKTFFGDSNLPKIDPNIFYFPPTSIPSRSRDHVIKLSRSTVNFQQNTCFLTKI